MDVGSRWGIEGRHNGRQTPGSAFKLVPCAHFGDKSFFSRQTLFRMLMRIAAVWTLASWLQCQIALEIRWLCMQMLANWAFCALIAKRYHLLICHLFSNVAFVSDNKPIPIGHQLKGRNTQLLFAVQQGETLPVDLFLQVHCPMSTQVDDLKTNKLVDCWNKSCKRYSTIVSQQFGLVCVLPSWYFGIIIQ